MKPLFLLGWMALSCYFSPMSLLEVKWFGVTSPTEFSLTISKKYIGVSERVNRWTCLENQKKTLELEKDVLENLRIYCSVHLYIHVFFMKEHQCRFATSSARRWVWIVVLRTLLDRPWRVAALEILTQNQRRLTAGSRKSPISKGKIIFQTPVFVCLQLVFRFFGSVLVWKDLSCSDRFSINFLQSMVVLFNHFPQFWPWRFPSNLFVFANEAYNHRS